MRYRISELAETCSINKETIRYYERIGVLSEPSRTDAGYRVYSLETLNANVEHYFCSTEECDVVYFDSNNKKYLISDIKVAVHQKDASTTTPLCYCFDWTKEKIEKYIKLELSPYPIEHIRGNINENRCGCEVNNPQGSCCLGNVTKYIKSIKK